MSDVTIEQEIISEVNQLDSEYKRRVLEYARSLKRPRGISGKEFIARTRDIYIPPAELDAMKQAIEEDCERIDLDDGEISP